MVDSIFSVWSQELPNKECGMLLVTLWKHAPLLGTKVHANLLGTPMDALQELDTGPKMVPIQSYKNFLVGVYAKKGLWLCFAAH